MAASQSGNIIRLGHAHPVAIAAWRLVLAALVLLPIAGRRLGELTRLTARQLALLLLAGAALAVHFFAWITAVQWTTVANAAIFFAVNPILTATAAHLFFGERASWRLALSVGLGLCGVAVIGLDELDLTAGSLSGDAMALLCSALFSVYFLAGKSLRRRLDNRTYVTAVYGVAAVVSFAVLLALDLPLVDYDAQTWLCFGLMAAVPTLIGHSSFNCALLYIDASRISASTLSEPLLAAVVAYFAWDEPVRPAAWAGYALVCASVAVLLTESWRRSL